MELFQTQSGLFRNFLELNLSRAFSLERLDIVREFRNLLKRLVERTGLNLRLWPLLARIITVLFKGFDVPVILLESLIDLALDLFFHSKTHVKPIESGNSQKDCEHHKYNDKCVRDRYLTGVDITELTGLVSLHSANTIFDCLLFDWLRLFVDEDGWVRLDLLSEESLPFF